MQTIVVNNREALVIAQLPHVGKDAAGRVLVGETVKLIPGVNLVESAQLKKLRENKLFDAHFTTKIARSPAPEQNPEKVGSYVLVQLREVPERKSLEKVPDNEAVEIVKETFNVKLLERWLHEDARGEVRAMIQNQITDIARGGAPTGA
jgi:hypothetical protein